MKTQIFDVDIAKEYGVNEAIIFNLLDFWIDKNRANEKNFYDGNYWTYNSIKSWGKLIPYLSERKIANALEHLEKEELIVVGNYNTSNYDRTKWYSITKKGYSIIRKCEIDLTKTQLPFDKIAEPIPVYITSIYNKEKEILKEKENTSTKTKPIAEDKTITTHNTYLQPLKTNSDDVQKYFLSTYSLYPRKVSKERARKTFEKKLCGLSEEEMLEKARLIYKVLQKQVQIWSAENNGEGRAKEYMPHMATWLNDNFEDSNKRR